MKKGLNYLMIPVVIGVMTLGTQGQNITNKTKKNLDNELAINDNNNDENINSDLLKITEGDINKLIDSLDFEKESQKPFSELIEQYGENWNEIARRALLYSINQLRINEGLEPLKMDSSLNQCTQDYAEYIVENYDNPKWYQPRDKKTGKRIKGRGHYDMDGDNFYKRIEREKYKFGEFKGGECLSQRDIKYTPKLIALGWQDSFSNDETMKHNEIMKLNYGKITGIGIEKKEDGKVFSVLMVGRKDVGIFDMFYNQ